MAEVVPIVGQQDLQQDHNNNQEAAEETLAVDTSNNNNNRFRPQDEIGNVILSEGDPLRMKLTKQEHDNACTIKEMVEGMPDLDNLNDFWYAQLAIICKDNVDNAIERCFAMQDFRYEYQIENRQHQALRVLRQHFELFPRQLLNFCFSEKDGTYVFVHDYVEFEPKRFTRPRLVIDWLLSMYYSHILFFPDFESIRRGIYCIVECENMSMRRDVMKYMSKFFEEFLTHYPFVGKCHHYHTGTMINVISSILRKILPKGELQDTFLVGLEFDGHMGEAFLTPTVEEANKRVRTKMEDTLKLRYDNEKSFSLED